MSDDPLYDRDFAPGFLRKVLALAIKTGLNRRVPGATLPAHFAGLADGGRNRSPRQRLAEVLERFEKDAPRQWPGAETMDHLVEREAVRLRSDEAAALVEEWRAVRDVSVPDAEYVEGQVRDWVERLGVQRAILRAAEMYQAGATAAEIRSGLVKALRESDTRPAAEVVDVLRTYPERVLLWERGDERGEPVPTGLRPLDRALGGGVRRGEFFLAMAPPKGMKTTFQINLALNASRAHFGVAYFSFEMKARPMLLRMDRNVTGATKRELRENPLLVEKFYRGMIAGGAGSVLLRTGMPQERDSAEMIVRQVEDWRREGHVVDAVFADFLNIMGASTDEREKRHELARIGRDMSRAAKELDVAWWSAALTKQASIGKAKLRKNDLAEAHEVVAVVDGLVGICCPEELVAQGMRSLFLSAIREEGDERFAGVYEADADTMTFRTVGDAPEGASENAQS